MNSTSVEKLEFKGSSNANALDLFYMGTISGPTFDKSSMSLSLSFNRTLGGAVNYSATLASPPEEPDPIVPEPLTILGAGAALGFGSFFKRKLAKKN